jgi:DNA adenine methylase
MKSSLTLFDDEELRIVGGPETAPFKTQLLKWVGNKQKFAHEIIRYFPKEYGTYYEPFMGSAAVLGTLAPVQAVASDVFLPLVEIFQTLHDDPAKLKHWYQVRWEQAESDGWETVYERVKACYNTRPNGADFLYLCRSCYGGVVRFRKNDGYMSTPCGAHIPIPPESFAKRVDIWFDRTKYTTFKHCSYKESMDKASPGDLIYCDPPYSHSQSILYGAQTFSLKELFEVITECKKRGIYVALSIDGTKHSGDFICDLPIPRGLFKRHMMVNCGRSMLKRFQMAGESLEGEEVSDRLLLTY